MVKRCNHVEFRLRHAGGHTIWLRANLKIQLSDAADLLTGYMVDISGERALTEALEDAARDLEQAIDMGPDWLFRITLYPGGGQRLDYSSNNIERVLGYSKNEMRAPGWFLSVLDPAQIPLLMDAAARLLRLEQVTNEYRLRDKSGNWIWISDTQRPAPRAEPDGSVRVVGYATDITAAKERSARLQQTARLAVLGEMAAGMAHEVRQPLAAISFAAQNAEMALERGDFASLATRLGRIVRQTERASGIIEHLRLFGRGADSADIPVPVSLEHVVDGTLSLIGETLRLDCVEVVRAPDGPLPTVMGHQMPLEQVLVNLLLNARDALMANRAPADRSIRIAAVANAMSVRFMVSDNAGGIPPDVMRVVFQPFVTTKLADKGTGLGLSICHGIITNMGGQIRVHNDDEGAVFTIILPAAQ
jgi:PAS domain S-box-containing protein